MLNRLEKAVLALAQSADVQLSSLPDFVCQADELALNFEEGLSELDGHGGEITGEQCVPLNALDKLISSMSGERNDSFWTDDAVRSHAVWEQIRTAAKAVAIAFGWELRHPPPSGAIYISVRR